MTEITFVTQACSLLPKVLARCLCYEKPLATKLTGVLLILFLATAVFSPAVFSAQPGETSVSSLPLPPASGGVKKLRVLLGQGSTLSLTMEPVVSLYEAETGSFVAASNKQESQFSRRGGAVYWNGKPIPDAPVRLISSSASFQMGQNQYAGEPVLLSKEEQLLLVNEVDMETYLRGVLPSEVFPSWPREALKAQAVASRTFALFSALKQAGQLFDLTATDRSQVYRGMTRYHQATDRAVRETSGEVLSYKGGVFPAFFHSTCGGHTSEAHKIWDVEPHPSLDSVSCPYCWASPHYSWQRTYSLEDLEKKLGGRGLFQGKLYAIEPLDADKLGRIFSFRLATSSGEPVVAANVFRLALGSEELKSTFFKMFTEGNSVRLEGFGWGHGVGLCQWGAKRMAEQGYDYRKILEFYYPHSKILNVNTGLAGLERER